LCRDSAQHLTKLLQSRWWCFKGHQPTPNLCLILINCMAEMILARKRANLTHQQRGSNATYGTYASQAQDAPSPSHAALWSLAARPGPSALYIDIKGYNSAQPFLSRAHQRFRAHDDVKQQAALQAATKPLSGAGDEASWPSGLPSRHSILDK
jgi:hypothetical protein